jgi:heme exporter protein A
MLVATNLECQKGNRRLFSGLGFSVERGQVLRVEGKNGSGKSSLIRMLCGLFKPDIGEIMWNGQRVTELGESYCAQLAYIGHNNGIKDELTAIENLCLSAQLSGTTVDYERVWLTLSEMGLNGRETLPTKLLSQGQKRRVALARLLVISKPLWLLDEPVASLDDHSVELMEGLIASHLSKGGLAVLTTHQPISTPFHATQYLQLGKEQVSTC